MPSLCPLQHLKLVVCVGLSPSRPAVHVWLFRRRSLSCCHLHSEAEKKRFQTSEIFQVSCRLLCQMLIYRVRPLPAKYVQVFRISGAPVSVWCCYCSPASRLEAWTGGTHSEATAASASARVGRQSCQSVASGVCFQTQPCLHAFIFNFYLSLFFRVTHVAATGANCKADERREQW